MYAQEDDDKDFKVASEQYQRGYLHVMDDVQRKIKLRSRDVTMNKGRLNQNHPSSSQQKTNNKKQKQNEQIVHKEPVDKVEKTREVKQLALKEAEKTVSTFNLPLL